jgi:predicted N-acyltransferase
MRRTGCQFHWRNHGYRDFTDFLDTFNSTKRKKVKQERRHVADAGVELEVLHGNAMSESQWRILHGFYCSTFERKSGLPTLTLPFFLEISRSMGESLVLVMARHRGEYVAGAICLRGADALFGRHWGCSADYHSLHFEACYYQGIDYCIQHGLQLFEPGAQGEHKISRGFLPTPTWSAHWIAHAGFREILSRYTAQESAHTLEYINELAQHSPYKKT